MSSINSSLKSSSVKSKSKLVHISDEMVSYILKNCPFYPEKTQVGSQWYIGYRHITNRYEVLDMISKAEAKQLFISDIQKIENYPLLKSNRTKMDTILFDVCVHFAFDYSIKNLKNSKISLYVKTNNLDKCIDELTTYKLKHNSFETYYIDNRFFDIQILKKGCYLEPEVKNVKQQSPRRNVGFRY